MSYDIEEDVWVQGDSDLPTIGITCVSAYSAGRINTVKFKPIGTFLARGKGVATIESSKYFGAVRTPISGNLVETNQELLEKPGLANKYPYSNGWFARIQPTSNEEEYSREFELLFAPIFAETKLRSLIEQLHIRCFSVYPDYEISGIGGECPETLNQLDQLMAGIQRDESVHLATDNPVADKDVPQWVSIRGHKILETRREGTLLHFIIGR
ncbi:MAG: sulfurtransferase TusA family protein [Thaumarchaeota archaeon]|nr:sulfurtransferase TusA family protein [Nitrososphaerota archaeon]